MKNIKKIVIIGSGEHAKIVIENILEQNTYQPYGMVSFNKMKKINNIGQSHLQF